MNTEKKIEIKMGNLMKVGVELIENDELLKDEPTFMMLMMLVTSKLEKTMFKDVDKVEVKVGDLVHMGMDLIKNDGLFNDNPLLQMSVLAFAGKLERKLLGELEE